MSPPPTAWTSWMGLKNNSQGFLFSSAAMNTVSKVTVCAWDGRKHNCRVEVEFGLQLHLQSPSEVWAAVSDSCMDSNWSVSAPSDTHEMTTEAHSWDASAVDRVLELDMTLSAAETLHG